MVQIFGTNKSFDTKTAQRFFKERRIPFQFIDLKEKEMSRGEFDNVFDLLTKSLGSKEKALEAMIDKKNKDYSSISYLDENDKKDKLFENQNLLTLPICRNGKLAATVGLSNKIWENWK